MKRALIFCLLACMISACSKHDAARLAHIAVTGSEAAARAYAADKVVHYATNPQALIRDIKRFREIIEAIWGKDDAKEPGTKEYVKYVDNYMSRATVDFEQGIVRVETLDEQQPLKSLRNAVITTVLTPNDPRAVDLYSAEPVKLGEIPFLYKEVRDYDGEYIRWEWRAGRFADMLMERVLQKETIRVQGLSKTVYSVQFSLVKDHLHTRAAKYRASVERYAKRFNISRTLIYAIIKVESDFNPFAVSTARAFGLMQVVPSTAGSDVYAFLNKREGRPGREFLFNTDNNILYGTAYLHLLMYRYLVDVRHATSREYCVISGYNGGPGTVLKTFHSDRNKAPGVVNSLTPAEVYSTLRTKVPYSETRRYLGKVLAAEKEFVNF